eukprot:SAG22_NODE_4658_length_1201_cov_4.325771_1_plen_184_part_00
MEHNQVRETNELVAIHPLGPQLLHEVERGLRIEPACPVTGGCSCPVSLPIDPFQSERDDGMELCKDPLGDDRASGPPSSRINTREGGPYIMHPTDYRVQVLELPLGCSRQCLEARADPPVLPPTVEIDRLEPSARGVKPPRPLESVVVRGPATCSVRSRSRPRTAPSQSRRNPPPARTSISSS